MLLYINHDKLVKEESTTEYKVAGVKETKGSKVLPKIKKWIKNISSLFMHLILALFERERERERERESY